MNSQLLYQQNPNILDFEATAVEVHAISEGRTEVILDRTYFYPTSGGQEHDTGRIGSASVVDVFKDEKNSRTVHVVQGEVVLGQVEASIDPERRLRHMQHHSAQHLLTQCLLRQSGCETISANINGYSPSTLDLLATQISKADLDAAELQANRIIYEDRVVRTYFVSPDELQSIPLRRPPRVVENIRIVEINGYDYSPCGGTHVARTGSIGLLKVLKTEKQNDKLRVHFIAGIQAMEMFHQMYDDLTRLASEMTISWQDLPDIVERQVIQVNSLQKDLQTYKQASFKYEAHDLVEQAVKQMGIRLVQRCFEDRPIGELRMLAEILKQVPDLVSFLATQEGQKVSLIVTCGETSGKDARQLLNTQLANINGRGGGDAKLAQGGGVATAEQYRSFLQNIDLR